MPIAKMQIHQKGSIKKKKTPAPHSSCQFLPLQVNFLKISILIWRPVINIGANIQIYEKAGSLSPVLLLHSR